MVTVKAIIPIESSSKYINQEMLLFRDNVYWSGFVYQIGIVETHRESTTDKDKLALNGYTFINDNHLQNLKRGGFGLYIKDSIPSKTRPDLVTLPECIVYEIQ